MTTDPFNLPSRSSDYGPPDPPEPRECRCGRYREHEDDAECDECGNRPCEGDCGGADDEPSDFNERYYGEGMA